MIPGNPARGLDAHQGIVTLFDGETGQPTAILDASAITEIRTAAVTAVATGVLARTDARTLAILGSGVQAGSHIEALTLVRPFEEIRIYSPSPEHARALAERHAGAAASVIAVAERRGGGPRRGRRRDRDQLPRAGRSSTRGSSPGVHVNAVGREHARARELEVETVSASALFADSRESVRQ